jgi:hypothetical protein
MITPTLLSPLMEWTGSIAGLLGAFLLASHSRISKFGWIAFLVANLAMICFAWMINANGLLFQQLGFSFTSCLGIYRSRPW